MATQVAQSMISEASICNQALGWVGAKTISSLDEPSNEAEWCNNNYEFLRDAVLGERMWTFAKAKAKSVSTDVDEWGSSYRHRLPEEWLAVYEAYSDPQATTVPPWYREGEWILSPESTLYMAGTKRIRDTAKFSQPFVQALAARLAADMAIPLTENRQLQADLWELYTGKIAEATKRDRQGRNRFVNDIAEQALNLLGGDRLIDNDNQNLIHEIMQHNYAPLRNAVIEDAFWSFARIRTASISDIRDDSDQYYVHAVPENWLSVYRVFIQPEHLEQDEWVREGATILSKRATIYMLGTQVITDSALYTPMFTQALVARIAAETALPVTQNRAVMESMWSLYNKKLADAAGRDGSQGRNELIKSNSLVKARHRR